MSKTSRYEGEVSEKLPYDAIESQVKFLQGKVLTVIDASYQEGGQKKAVKDLINKAFSEQLTWILQLCVPNPQSSHCS